MNIFNKLNKLLNFLIFRERRKSFIRIRIEYLRWRRIIFSICIGRFWGNKRNGWGWILARLEVRFVGFSQIRGFVVRRIWVGIGNWNIVTYKGIQMRIPFILVSRRLFRTLGATLLSVKNSLDLRAQRLANRSRDPRISRIRKVKKNQFLMAKWHKIVNKNHKSLETQCRMKY